MAKLNFQHHYSGQKSFKYADLVLKNNFVILSKQLKKYNRYKILIL